MENHSNAWSGGRKVILQSFMASNPLADHLTMIIWNALSQPPHHQQQQTPIILQRDENALSVITVLQLNISSTIPPPFHQTEK